MLPTASGMAKSAIWLAEKALPEENRGMSAWSCPHDLNSVCQLVQGAACDPGMRGCVLHGKVRFANDEKSRPRKPVKSEKAAPSVTPAKRRLPF